MLTKTDIFYRNNLRKYFNKKFLDYAETVEYHVDPDINIWKFDIPELDVTVILTCDDSGVVTEIRKPLKGAVR